MFEIPEGLAPELMGLAWLLGSWEGRGHGTWPGEGDFEFGQRVDVSHNGGAYLVWVSQLFDLDADGEPTGTRSMELGFFRPQPDGQVELVMCHPEGWSELYVGTVEGAKLELVTDGVVRAVSASTPYSGGRRLFGNVQGQLMWTYDRVTDDVPLQNYLWGTLVRAGQGDGPAAPSADAASDAS